MARLENTQSSQDWRPIPQRSYRATLDSHNLSLDAHDDTRWLTPDNFDSVPWAAADKPIVAMLRKK